MRGVNGVANDCAALERSAQYERSYARFMVTDPRARFIQPRYVWESLAQRHARRLSLAVSVWADMLDRLATFGV